LNPGSLVVVGTGIRTLGHLTTEAIAWIRLAGAVPYVVSDPIAEAAIRQLNPGGAESLAVFYGEGKPRAQTYAQMVERILACVRAGKSTCAVFYGHPGVFVTPSHEAVRRARAEGYEARMLPAVSAEDCLFADLGIDPAAQGCQSYDATDFLINTRRLDPTSAVVLWQIGIAGDWTYRQNGYDLAALPLLIEKLRAYYRPDHPVVVYEAAVLPGCAPRVLQVPLAALSATSLSVASTLYIPPANPPVRDVAVYQQLGLAV
jgi:uncharacterized protein YabN with tetrapyrrole methylase and pyrophosphatase domain